MGINKIMKKYCSHCGCKMVAEEWVQSYDDKTGRPVIYRTNKCSGRGWFDGIFYAHDKTTYDHNGNIIELAVD